LKTPSGRLLGINAASSYEKVLEAVPATAEKASENGIPLGIVVDLDDRTVEDRREAVRGILRSSAVVLSQEPTVVGIGLNSSTVAVAADKDLDQVVTEIVLRAQPHLVGVLKAAVDAVRGLPQEPTWKLGTCILAAALGRESSPEAIYHHAAKGLKDQARLVLSEAGLLTALEALAK